MADLISANIIRGSKQLHNFFLPAHPPGESLQTLLCLSLHTVIDAHLLPFKKPCRCEERILRTLLQFFIGCPHPVIQNAETFRGKPGLLSNFSTTYMQHALICRHCCLASGFRGVEEAGLQSLYCSQPQEHLTDLLWAVTPLPKDLPRAARHDVTVGSATLFSQNSEYRGGRMVAMGQL